MKDFSIENNRFAYGKHCLFVHNLEDIYIKFE